ncbi:MAG: hypothetical protein HY720_17975 [Planctomycetes bacterium]|nr:hypothetical protein [Planctomycetota bacterium]
MDNCTIGIFACFLALALAGVTNADEVDPGEFLRELNEKYYTNVGGGVTDFSVEVRDDRLAMYPEIGNAKVVARFYWKPARGLKILLEGLPDTAEDRAGEIRSYLEDQWLKHVLIRPYSEEFRNYQLSVDSTGGKFVVVATAVGTFNESNAERMEVVFGRGLAPEKRETAIHGGGTIEELYGTTVKDEKVFVKEIRQKFRGVPDPATGQPGDFDMTVRFEYGQVGEYYFPTRIAASAQGREMAVTFENYKVNEGFDDAIYDR